MANNGAAPFPNLSDALHQLGHQLHADLTDDVYRRDAARHFENHLQCTLNQAKATKTRAPLFQGPSRLVPECGGCGVETMKKPIRHVPHRRRQKYRQIDRDLGPTESDTTEASTVVAPRVKPSSRMTQRVSSNMNLIQRQETNFQKRASKTAVAQSYQVSEDLPTRRKHGNRTGFNGEKNGENQKRRRYGDYQATHNSHDIREATSSQSQIAVSFSKTKQEYQSRDGMPHETNYNERRPEKMELSAMHSEHCNYGRIEQKFSSKWEGKESKQNYMDVFRGTDDNAKPNVEAASNPENPDKNKDKRARTCLPNRVEDAVPTAPAGQTLYAPVELHAAAESAVKSIDRSVGALERLILLSPKDAVDRGLLKTIQLMCVFLRQFHTELRSKRDRRTKLELVLRMWSVLQTQSSSGNQGQQNPSDGVPVEPSKITFLSTNQPSDDTPVKTTYLRPVTRKSNGEEPTIKPQNMSPSSVQVDFTEKKDKPHKSR